MSKGFVLCILACAFGIVAVVLAKEQSVPNFTYDEVKAGLRLGKDASVRFADLLRSPALSAAKKTKLKEAILSESAAAPKGKECCLPDAPYKLMQRCTLTSTYKKSHYKCGIFWWGDCYRETVKSECRKKGINQETTPIKLPSIDPTKCLKRDKVCCPGTVWYGHLGKCVDIKKICQSCDCCA